MSLYKMSTQKLVDKIIDIIREGKPKTFSMNNMRYNVTKKMIDTYHDSAINPNAAEDLERQGGNIFSSVFKMLPTIFKGLPTVFKGLSGVGSLLGGVSDVAKLFKPKSGDGVEISDLIHALSTMQKYGALSKRGNSVFIDGLADITKAIDTMKKYGNVMIKGNGLVIEPRGNGLVIDPRGRGVDLTPYGYYRR